MEIVRPFTVDDASLDSSSVPETAPSAYAGGTTYDAADEVSVFTGTAALVYRSLVGSNTGNTPASSPTFWEPTGATYATYSGGTTYALDAIVIGADHHEYQSLQASNTGHSLADPAWWLDLGFDNRWRMFDQLNSSQTSVPEGIDVVVDVTGRANGVSLLNITATTVQIIATTVDGEIYNETFELVSTSGVNNWYDYFFEPIIRQGDLVVTDLPLNADPTIEVILSEPGGTCEVGTLVIGQSLLLGGTVYGARIGIQDYSRKVVDEFGNSSVVERAFAKRATFRVAMAAAKVDAAAAFLATIRAVPVVYRGTDQYTSTWIFGFFKDWSIEITYPDVSYCNLDIEGLT